MQSFILQDPSLLAAEAQRDNQIQGSLPAEVASLRRANDELQYTLHQTRKDRDEARRDLNRSRNDFDDLRDDFNKLEEQSNREIEELRQNITELERQATPRRRKAPRRDSQGPSPSPSASLSQHGSRNPSAQPTRPASPMQEIQAEHHPRTAPAQPLLLARLSSAPPSSAEPSPSVADTLFPRLDVPGPIIPIGTNVPVVDIGSSMPIDSPYAQTGMLPPISGPVAPNTPINPTMGFPSLLPILYADPERTIVSAPGSATLNAQGHVDLSAHTHFVFATGGFLDGSPAWTTTLMTSKHISSQSVQDAMKARMTIPFGKSITGGRNGVLIALCDPTSDDEVDQLFNNTDRYAYLKYYIDRVRFTPPELRGEVHTRALERWNASQAARRAQYRASGRRPEPLPSAPDGAWKKWLKDMRELPQSGATFKYAGIPLVGQGYQAILIKGAKAILAFLPLNARQTAVQPGPLRNAFVRTAAALLSVPDRYREVLNSIHMEIAPHRSNIIYEEAQFTAANALGIDDIARFLAATGVTPEEAEQWRPWAAAFVEMELEERPNSNHAPLLRQARELTHARIESDPTKALQRVHGKTPGNYRPERERLQAEQNPTQPRQSPAGSSSTPQPDSGPSKTTTGDRSRSRSRSVHPDDARSQDVPLSYGDTPDEDTQMGPAQG